MGKHRFRLSDMMPNAWFYKLKDMSKPHPPPLPKLILKTQKQPPPPPLIPNRASYYFPSNSPSHPKAIDTTHFPPDSRSPRKSSSTTRPPRRRKVLPTPRSTTTSPRLLLLSNISSTSTCSRASLSESDHSDLHHNSYCINSNNNTTTTPPKLEVLLDLVGSELDLRPILTKPPAANKPNKKQDISTLKRPTTPKPTTTSTSAVQPPRLRSSTSSSTRWTSSSAVSPGRKVRVAARRPLVGRRSRRGIDESFAVVKSSSDPRRDFRESMMEMILENRLTASKDLEDLLACYLSLNSNQYHDVIVKVFQEIWLDITNFVNK